jgi:hypothetical protein
MYSRQRADFVAATEAAVQPLVDAAEAARDEALTAPIDPVTTALSQGVNAGAETLPVALEYVQNSLRIDALNDYYRSTTAISTTLAGLNITSVTQAAATYADWNGGFGSFAANTLRETPGGIVVEPSRTNSLTYSEDLMNAAWNPTRMNKTGSAGTDPLGGNAMVKLVPTAVAGTHTLGRSTLGATNSGDVRGASLFFKAAGYSQIRLELAANTGMFAQFDLSTGTVISSGGVFGGTAPSTVRIRHIGGGIYRCTIRGTFNASNTGQNCNFTVFVMSGGTTSFTGDGTSGVLAWGGMYPDGHLSYVPNTGAGSTTVAADVVEVDLPAGAAGDTITHTRGGAATSVLRSSLADPLVFPVPTGSDPITAIELAPAATSAGQELARLKTAVREYALFPRPLAALAAGDTPTLTVGTGAAASTIDGTAVDSPRIPRTSTLLTYVSGVPMAAGPSYPKNLHYVSRGAYYGVGVDRGCAYHAYEFVHTGTAFEISTHGSGSSGTNFRVLVNGHVAATAAITNNDGARRFVKLVFPGSGTRTIRIETANVPCNGVHVANSNEVASVARTYPVCTLISDSFWEGTGSDVGDIQSIVMARALGMNAALASVGSTGLISTGTSPKVAWTDANRLTDLTLSGVTDPRTGLAVSPALGVIGASLNDQGLSAGTWGAFGATLTDAIVNRADVLIDAWIAANPGKPLVWFGPTWPSGQPNNRPTLDIYRIRDGVQRACASRAAQNVWFIDRLMPALREGIYSTAGDQASLYTGGLTGTDATHPTPAGHRLDGLWMAEQLRRLILTHFA